MDLYMLVSFALLKVLLLLERNILMELLEHAHGYCAKNKMLFP